MSLLVHPADRHLPRDHPSRTRFKTGYRHTNDGAWQRTLEDGRVMLLWFIKTETYACVRIYE